MQLQKEFDMESMSLRKEPTVKEHPKQSSDDVKDENINEEQKERRYFPDAPSSSKKASPSLNPGKLLSFSTQHLH